MNQQMKRKIERQVKILKLMLLRLFSVQKTMVFVEIGLKDGAFMELRAFSFVFHFLFIPLPFNIFVHFDLAKKFLDFSMLFVKQKK